LLRSISFRRTAWIPREVIEVLTDLPRLQLNARRPQKSVRSIRLKRGLHVVPKAGKKNQKVKQQEWTATVLGSSRGGQ